MLNFILFYNIKNLTDTELIYFLCKFAKQCTSDDENERMLMDSEVTEEGNIWLKNKYLLY